MPHGGVSVYFLSTDGGQWARYIEDKLTSQQYGIVTHLNEFKNRLDNHTKSLYLNVFVITPDFLDLPTWRLMAEFDKNASMLILTGVDQDDLLTGARTMGCPGILGWPRFELQGTEESVRELMISIIKAYETVHDYDRVPCTPRQVNPLRSVSFKDGRLQVALEKVADSCVSVLVEDLHPANTGHSVYMFPGTDDIKVSVFLNTHNIGSAYISGGEAANEESKTSSVSIGTQTEGDPEPKEYNAETNEHLIGTGSGVDVNIKDDDEAKKHAKDTVLRNVTMNQSKLELLHALLEEETEPARILCQCLGIEEHSEAMLDEKMTSLVTCSETLKHLSFPTGSSQECHQSVWPTLLHLGAQYNLLMFCDALLSNPLMYSACLKRNKDGLLPHDIARNNDHKELADLLEHFTAFVLAEKDRIVVKSLSARVKYDSGFSGTPRLSTMVQPYIPELTSPETDELTPPNEHTSLNYKELVDALGRSTGSLNFTWEGKDDSMKSSVPKVPEITKSETTTRYRSRSKSPLRRLRDRIQSGDYDQADQMTIQPVSDDMLSELQQSLGAEAIAVETKSKKGIFSKLFKTKRKTRRGSIPEVTIDHHTLRHDKLHKSSSDSQRSSDSSSDSVGFKHWHEELPYSETMATDYTPPRPCKSATVRSRTLNLEEPYAGGSTKSIAEETGLQADSTPLAEKEDHLRASFLGNTWERKSIRLQIAKEDKNLTGPPLPSRKPKEKL